MFLDQKHFGLILSEDERNNMILDGIQSEYLCKIRSGAGDRKTSGVDAEKKKLNGVYRKKYRVVSFAKGTDVRLNIRVNPQRRSLKAILLLFIEPYVTRTRDTE